MGGSATDFKWGTGSVCVCLRNNFYLQEPLQKLGLREKYVRGPLRKKWKAPKKMAARNSKDKEKWQRLYSLRA